MSKPMFDVSTLGSAMVCRYPSCQIV